MTNVKSDVDTAHSDWYQAMLVNADMMSVAESLIDAAVDEISETGQHSGISNKSLTDEGGIIDQSMMLSLNPGDVLEFVTLYLTTSGVEIMTIGQPRDNDFVLKIK